MGTRKKPELSDVELRLLERRKAARHIVFMRMAKWIGICAVVSIVLWALLYSPLFKVNQVVINIVCTDNKNQMYELDSPPENIPQNCGVRDYINRDKLNDLSNSLMQDGAISMVWLSTNSLEDQYSTISGVKSSSVAKSWPSKLIVALEPRVPIAHEGGNVLDADGEILGITKEGMPPLPEFQVASPARQDVLLLLDAVRKEPAFSMGVAKATATGRDDIALTRTDGMTIIFGNSNNLTLKLADINQILSLDLGGRKTIDVSSPTDPVSK